jgi:hypothetical protein
LVRVAEEQQLVCARAEPGHQRRLQGVEMLGIVDDQVTHPLAFPAQHLGVGVEHQQRLGHQLGRVQGRCPGLRGCGAHRSAQQHHLLVAAEEAPGGYPFVPPAAATERDEVLRCQPPFRGAHQ